MIDPSGHLKSKMVNCANEENSKFSLKLPLRVANIPNLDLISLMSLKIVIVVNALRHCGKIMQFQK